MQQLQTLCCGISNTEWLKSLSIQNDCFSTEHPFSADWLNELKMRRGCVSTKLFIAYYIIFLFLRMFWLFCETFLVCSYQLVAMQLLLTGNCRSLYLDVVLGIRKSDWTLWISMLNNHHNEQRNIVYLFHAGGDLFSISSAWLISSSLLIQFYCFQVQHWMVYLHYYIWRCAL